MNNKNYIIYYNDGTAETNCGASPTEAAIKSMAERIKDGKNWYINNVVDEGGYAYSISVGQKQVF